MGVAKPVKDLHRDGERMVPFGPFLARHLASTPNQGLSAAPGIAVIMPDC
jgi:hypothetical protein